MEELTLYNDLADTPPLLHYRGVTIPDAMDALQKWLTSMHNRASVKSNAEEDSFYIAEYIGYASGKK